MRKFSYGNFRIFDYKEMARFFMDGAECNAHRELLDVVPNNVDITETDLLKLKIELLREGFEVDLLDINEGDAIIADKAYSHYVLTVTPKLEEFFNILETEAEGGLKPIQIEKYRNLISNITEKVRQSYNDFDIKADLHKEKLNRYQRSIEENKNILNAIAKKCEDDIKDFDKKLKVLETPEQIKLASE